MTLWVLRFAGICLTVTLRWFYVYRFLCTLQPQGPLTPHLQFIPVLGYMDQHSSNISITANETFVHAVSICTHDSAAVLCNRWNHGPSSTTFSIVAELL